MNSIAIAAVLLALAMAASADDKKANMLVQAAQAKETLQGDLRAAIDLYGQAAKEAVPNRALAARALLGMAECYQKLGDSESQRVYERIVRDYSDQKEAVVTARAKLERKTALSTRLAMDTAGMGFYLDSIHIDGRLAAGGDWSTGDLCLRDMVTGQVRKLLTGSLEARTMNLGRMPAGSSGMPVGRYVAWSFISPNQKQVAFSRYNDPENPSQGQLWVISTEPGSTPRPLTKKAEFQNVAVHGWSPDGQHVLAHIELVKQGGYQIAWISAADGSVRVVKSGPLRESPYYGLRVSPDGNYIAYARGGRQVEGSNRVSQIRVLSADGTVETVITPTADWNDNPEWTPDGSHILFMSDRTGTWDLWSIPVRNGKAAGQQLLVKRNVLPAGSESDVSLGITRSGSYYHSFQNSVHNVSVTDLKATGHPQETFVGRGPGLSPDGKLVGFYKWQSERGWYLVVRSLETGKEETYWRRGLLTPPPVWFHDGKAVLVTTLDDAQTECTIYRVDLATGEFKQMLQLETRLAAGDLYSLSLDDKTVYVAGREVPGGLDNKIVAYDLATGQHRDVFTLRGGINPPRLSPDGRTLSFHFVDGGFRHVACVGTDGSNYREIYKDHAATISGNAWAADGRGLLFSRRKSDNNWEIVSVPLTGGEPIPLGIRYANAPADMSVSSDGLRLSLYTTRRNSEVWAIDNILSNMK